MSENDLFASDTAPPLTGFDALAQFPIASINAILWFSAAIALFLLLTVGLMSEIVTSKRRDTVMRFLKVFLYITIPVLAVVPGLTATAGTDFLLSAALIFYVVFFVAFCYYLGKRVGVNQGQRQIRELVGMDSTESVEEAQDRLFESRMRFLSRAEVVESIGTLAKAREAERLERERAAAGRPASTDVEAVEAVFQHDIFEKR